MKVEVVFKENNLSRLLGISPIGYEDAVKEALGKIS